MEIKVGEAYLLVDSCWHSQSPIAVKAVRLNGLSGEVCVEILLGDKKGYHHWAFRRDLRPLTEMAKALYLD